MPDAATTAAAEVPAELLRVLSAETAACEAAVHRAVLLDLLLGARAHPQLAAATAELADATLELQAVGVARAAVVESVAVEWGVAADGLVGLAELTGAAAGMARAEKLVAVGERLRGAAAELERVVARARERAGEQSEEVTQALAALADDPEGSYPSGSAW